MDLTDLDANERLALIALLRTTVLADRAVSEEEGDMLAEIVDAFGAEAYQAAGEEIDRRFQTEAALKSFLSTIERTEAREIIYGLALEMAMADVITGHEIPLLGWLADTWKVEAAIEGGPAPDDDV